MTVTHVKSFSADSGCGNRLSVGGRLDDLDPRSAAAKNWTTDDPRAPAKTLEIVYESGKFYLGRGFGGGANLLGPRTRHDKTSRRDCAQDMRPDLADQEVGGLDV